jgi:hypothetical protein
MLVHGPMLLLQHATVLDMPQGTDTPVPKNGFMTVTCTGIHIMQTYTPTHKTPWHMVEGV